MIKFYWKVWKALQNLWYLIKETAFKEAKNLGILGTFLVYEIQKPVNGQFL